AAILPVSFVVWMVPNGVSTRAPPAVVVTREWRAMWCTTAAVMPAAISPSATTMAMITSTTVSAWLLPRGGETAAGVPVARLGAVIGGAGAAGSGLPHLVQN